MDPVAATAAAAVAALVLSGGALWFAAKSANASEASVRTAGEAVEIARAVRNREDAPRFDLTPGQPRDAALPVTIRVVSGPPSIYVTAVYNTTSEAAPRGAVALAAQAALDVGGDSSQHGEVSSERQLINGDEFVVNARCRVADPVTVDVEVWLLSTAADDGRQWNRKERVAWPPST